MCGAFATRSSETCSGFCLVRLSLRSRPITSKHCSTRAQPSAALPRDVVGEAALAHGSLEEKRAHTWVPRSSDGLEANKRTRQTEWRKPRTDNEQSHGGSRRPAPWPMGAASIAATTASRSSKAHVLVSSSSALPWSVTLIRTFSLLS